MNTNAKVVHCKKSAYDVYVGRPSKWGNPFEIGKDGGREDVIRKYRFWLGKQPKLIDNIKELKNKILACWCAPKSCHADVLVELVNADYVDKCPQCLAPLGMEPWETIECPICYNECQWEDYANPNYYWVWPTWETLSYDPKFEAQQ